MKRMLQIVWMALVSTAIIIWLLAGTSMMFGFPLKCLNNLLIVAITWFAVSLPVYIGVFLIPRHHEPNKQYLYQLIIGKNNMGMYLTSLREEDFRKAVVEYLVKSANEINTTKMIAFLKIKDVTLCSVNYRVVGIVPKNVV